MERVWFIKIHRQIEDSAIWGKPSEWLKIWLYILMEVNFKDASLPIGSKFMNYDWIQNSCHVSKSTVDHFLRWGKSTGMLETEKTVRGFVVTVLNYSDYQSTEIERRTAHKPLTDQQREIGDTVWQKWATEEAIECTIPDEEYWDIGATWKATEERNSGDRRATLYKKKERRKEGKNSITTNVVISEITKNSFEEAELRFGQMETYLKWVNADEVTENDKELTRFYEYWTAPMKSGKLLWKSKPTFAFNARLRNWLDKKNLKWSFNSSPQRSWVGIL